MTTDDKLDRILLAQEKILARLCEHDKRWDEQGKRWVEQGKRWDEQDRRWVENEKRWIEQDKRWVDQDKRWVEQDKRWVEQDKRWVENEKRWVENSKNWVANNKRWERQEKLNEVLATSIHRLEESFMEFVRRQEMFNEKLFVVIENEIVDRLVAEADGYKSYADERVEEHTVRFRHVPSIV